VSVLVLRLFMSSVSIWWAYSMMVLYRTSFSNSLFNMSHWQSEIGHTGSQVPWNHATKLRNTTNQSLFPRRLVFKPFRTSNADLCFHGMFHLGNRNLVLFIWLLTNFISISLLRVPYPSRQPYWIEFLLRNLKWLPSYGVISGQWEIYLDLSCLEVRIIVPIRVPLFTLRAESLLWLPDPLTPQPQVPTLYP
jgi:hypothetical protein